MVPHLEAGIKRRGLLGGLAALAAAGTTMTRAVAAPALAPAAPAPILLLESHVAGTAYYDATALMAGLCCGQGLVLRRQPTNRYDTMAIEVLVADGGKLGYVPRRHNQPLARLMDAGKSLHGDIMHLSPEKWDDVWLRVWMVG